MESIVYDLLCQEASCRAWVMAARMDCRVVVIESRPLDAALMTLMPVIESSRLVNSSRRAESGGGEVVGRIVESGVDLPVALALLGWSPAGWRS